MNPPNHASARNFNLLLRSPSPYILTYELQIQNAFDDKLLFTLVEIVKIFGPWCGRDLLLLCVLYLEVEVNGRGHLVLGEHRGEGNGGGGEM